MLQGGGTGLWVVVDGGGWLLNNYRYNYNSQAIILVSISDADHNNHKRLSDVVKNASVRIK